MLEKFLSRSDESAGASEAQRVERTLAAARSFLAASSLVALWVDPALSAQYAILAYALLLVYVIHSLLILVLVGIRSESSPAFRTSVHAVDVIWPLLLSMVTTGVSSPFFVFSLFALLAAAYRWGFIETMATAAVTIVFYFMQTIYIETRSSSIQRYLLGGAEYSQFVTRGLYLLIIGYLLGYLGEEEKRLRADIAAIARVVTRVQGEVGLHGALRAVFEEVLRMFGSKRATLALQELSTGRAYMWEIVRESRSQEITLSSMELKETQYSTYLFESPGHAWHVVRRRRLWRDKRLDLYAVSEKGARIHDLSWKPPAWFQNLSLYNSVLGVRLAFGADWSGQALILDPLLVASPENDVPFLLSLARQVTPAIYSVFLMRRLRSRVGAVERARVARELHDGVIQSLIGLEMQVDVLRQQSEGQGSRVAADLSRVQQLLRQEVLNLRELMQQMRPVDVAPKRFLDYLAITVDKFGREAGMSARFVSPFDEVAIPPRVCTEVARIIQEALVNVRKHSQARNVMVRFDAQDGNWRLVIDDDGRGFDFVGRLNQAELDAAHKGPLVIKERVRSIGGELVVESGLGRGSRLEITFPRKTYG